MSEPKRIPAKVAHRLIKSGESQVVCAYADEAKCNEMKLPWAVSFSEFELKAPSLPKDQPIIFY